MPKHIFILFNILLLSQLSFSQKCYDYHTQCDIPKSKFEYFDTKYSVSYFVLAGVTKQAKIKLNSGKDYRVIICADSVFNDAINVKLVNEEGKIVYNNAEFNYERTLEFMSKKNQTAYIEVSVPDMINANGTIPKGCVGIRIQSVMSARLGF